MTTASGSVDFCWVMPSPCRSASSDTATQQEDKNNILDDLPFTPYDFYLYLTDADGYDAMSGLASHSCQADPIILQD